MTYQNTVGTISPGAHPGSYNGQDAYNDMLVTDDGTIMHGNRTGERRNHEGGCPTLTDNHEQPILMSDRKGHNGITDDGTSTTLNAQEKDRPLIATKELNDATARNPILRILRETYGAEAVLQWGTAILERLQQTEVLRPGVHESSVSGETENRGKLGNASSVCTADKTERIMRNLWEYEKRGRSSCGRESSEQFSSELEASLPELPSESTQASAFLLDMWSKGKGLELLQSALHSLQKVRKSAMGERTGGGGAMTSVVRRLTPLE